MAKTPALAIEPMFFDYFSSTPLLNAALEKMHELYSDIALQANPSSQHAWGQYARDSIDRSKETILRSLSLPPNPLVFTSCATESIHLALLGSIEAYPRPSHHIVSWATEHPSTLGALERARELYGASIHVLDAPSGRVNLNQLEDTLKKNPVFLITLSYVQHELGIIHPLKEVCLLAEKYGALVHVDASQAIGKLEIDFSQVFPDFITLPSHKCFGPKGIAALYIASSRKRHISAQLTGGQQQYKLRSGTEPVVLINAMSYVYEHISSHVIQWMITNKTYHEQIVRTLDALQVSTLSPVRDKVLQTLMLTIPENSQDLWRSVIMCSQGSACGDYRGKLSSTLLHMNIDRKVISNSYRISWCHLTTESELQCLISLLKQIYA